jgi:hypothetical protein
MNEYIQKIDYVLDELRQAYINYHRNPENEESSKAYYFAKNKIDEIYTRIINAQSMLDTKALETELNKVSDEITGLQSLPSGMDDGDKADIAAVQINDMSLLYKNQIMANVGITVGCLIMTLLAYNVYKKVSE